MKNLFFAAVMLISASAFAQKDTLGLHIPMSNGSVVYERVFNAPGKTKWQLYNNAQQWFIARYKSDKSIEITDTANMRVIGKGKELVNFVGPMNMNIPFDDKMTVQIDCKDGRYRCRLYEMTLISLDSSEKDSVGTSPEDLVNSLTGKTGSSVFNKNQSRRMLESLNDTINDTMSSLNKTMTDKDDF